MRDKTKILVARGLLCFVLISIGYALGKEVTLRRMRTEHPADAPATSQDEQVVVYYMYPAIRCVTCNQIEAAARKVVHEDFADALKAGRLNWQEVNISENDALAKRYNVASSVVVVVRRQGGADVDFNRLDEVWTLAEKPDKLAAHIREAVEAALAGGDEK
jgi:hypothetical protein